VQSRDQSGNPAQSAEGSFTVSAVIPRAYLPLLLRRREAFSRTENTEISQNSVPSVPPWFDPGYQRFRPYVSCDDTQSSEEMAAASETSPASATPATISANFCTLPRP
jgi:hypothetical protein